MRIELRGMLLGAALLVAGVTAGQAQAANATGMGAAKSGMAGMMARHDSLDKVLAAKMQAMNAARGQQKVEAMAAVINELVSQRAMMHAMMMRPMRGGMGMEGMAGHGKHGMGQGMRGECPMMKKMQPDSSTEHPGG